MFSFSWSPLQTSSCKLSIMGWLWGFRRLSFFFLFLILLIFFYSYLIPTGVMVFYFFTLGMRIRRRQGEKENSARHGPGK